MFYTKVNEESFIVLQLLVRDQKSIAVEYLHDCDHGCNLVLNPKPTAFVQKPRRNLYSDFSSYLTGQVAKNISNISINFEHHLNLVKH